MKWDNIFRVLIMGPGTVNMLSTCKALFLMGMEVYPLDNG